MQPDCLLLRNPEIVAFGVPGSHYRDALDSGGTFRCHNVHPLPVPAGAEATERVANIGVDGTIDEPSPDRREGQGRVQEVRRTPGFVTDGVLALHTRPTPGAFNRVGLPPRALSPAGLVSDESSPGCGLGGLGSSHSAPMTGVANRVSSQHSDHAHKD